MIRFLMLILCVFSSIWPASIALAAGEPTWFEHVDLMEVTISFLFAGVLWFAVRTLNKVDANQTILFTRLTEIEKDFYEMRGEHRANGLHVHHRQTDL